MRHGGLLCTAGRGRVVHVSRHAVAQVWHQRGPGLFEHVGPPTLACGMVSWQVSYFAATTVIDYLMGNIGLRYFLTMRGFFS